MAVATIVELLGDGGNVIRFQCAAAAMPKGTLCKITTPRTAAATAADNDMFAGIACEENDGTQTDIGLYTCGLFEMTDSGAGITIGEKVSIKAANAIAKVDSTDVIFSDVGVALTTLAGAGVGIIAVGVY